MVKSNKTLTFKVVMVGNSGVGKTSLVNRIVNGTFNEQEAPTIGSQYVSVERTVENQQITLELWDNMCEKMYECFGPENKKNNVELNSNKKGKCMI